MFNVTVIDGKRILKYIIAIIIIIMLTVILKQAKNQENINNTMKNASEKIRSNSFINCMNTAIASMRYLNKSENEEQIDLNKSFISNVLNSELGVKNRIVAKNIIDEVVNSSDILDNISQIIDTEIPSNITTQVIEENNIKATYTNTYENVEIKNRSGYDLTTDMLTPNISLDNKKDIIIYHTHTCESYTPTEKFNYQMTGNYRTTDLNYSVVRVRK